MPSTQRITVTVNGVRYERSVEPRLLLSDFLRHELSLTGTHVGCEHGICGACTVLLDGLATRSCLCLAVQADRASIETVESLGRPDALHPVQQAFWEKHGLQCGFCTPGMLMCAVELLRANPNPDRDAIVEAIGGNLCRCTGYQNIVKAVQYAAKQRSGGAVEPGPGTDLEFQHKDVIEHAPENLQDWGDQLAGQEEQ